MATSEAYQRITGYQAGMVDQLSKLKDLRTRILDLRDATPVVMGQTLGETERTELDQMANKVAEMFNRRFFGPAN